MKIFEITLLFLGSVIGAGFATGAEIITFFGDLRLPTWIIAIVIGLTMFTIITLEVLLNYPNKNRITPLKTNYATKPTLTTKIFDVISLLTYFILFTAMTAGITSITNPFIAILSLIISAVIVLFGFHKLSRLNLYIVLVIIVLIITTALPHLNSSSPKVDYHFNDVPNSIFWACLYAGLNCFMFPELIKASAQNVKRRTLLWAGAVTALFITILVTLILTTIKNTNTQTAEIPMLTAAPNFITLIVILLAVLTSQYTALFAIIQRTQKLLPNKNQPVFLLVGICILTFFCSFCGFSQIISYAYPLIGGFTCVFLLLSCLQSWQPIPHR